MSLKQDKNILLIDDEADMRVFISRLLESAGFEPIIANDIQDGLEKAQRILPALIILDITIHGEQGVRIFCTLKQDERLKKIPVIILSNIDQKTFWHYQRIQCSQLGMRAAEPEAYLKKPPEADEFIGFVNALIDSKADHPAGEPVHIERSPDGYES